MENRNWNRNSLAVDALGVAGAAVLPADLAELARPERETVRIRRCPSARRRRRAPTSRTAPPAKETPRQLILAAHIRPEGFRVTDRLLAAAPEQLRPQHKALVKRLLQRAIAERGVDAEQLRRRLGSASLWP